MDESATGQALSGQLLRGYQINELIGIGGFGSVYRARQSLVERDVVIKVIRSDLVNRLAFVRRFEAEARLIARLEHVHIVPLYDYWREPSGAYLVMRLLRGGSLQDYLHKKGALDLSHVTQILAQVGAALDAAHNQSVIHRDLKPANILLDEYGNAYLSDFGIAVDLVKRDDVSQENLSYGSPHYLPPEQIETNIVVPQSDIYSLGILIYEVLTNKMPFEGSTTRRLLEQQLHDPLPSLRKHRDDLPQLLDSVLWRATAKNYQARFQSATEFARAFANVAEAISPATIQPAVDTGSIRDANTIQLEDDALHINAAGQIPTLDDLATGMIPQNPAENIAQLDPIVAEDYATGQIETPRDPHHDDPPFTAEDLATGRIALPPQPDPDLSTKVLDAAPIQRNPYKGLRPFEEGDAVDFYGRDELVKRLQLALIGGRRFMTLIGASGSGKSSIVKAGLIPKLRAGQGMGNEWVIASMVPSSDPFVELKEALLGLAVTQPDELETQLREEERTLSEIFALLSPDEPAPLLLFIDQFEELFTLVADEAERAAFIDVLVRTVTDTTSRVRIVLTLRADFYDRPLAYSQFGELLRQYTELVLPLNNDGLRKVIVEPAQNANLTVDPHLVGQIVADVKEQPGALPLLQYAMTELYERRADNQLTLAAYRAIGGISGALAQRAEALFRELSADQQTLAKRLFLRLVSVEDTNATRRRVLWPEIFSGSDKREMMQEVLDRFSQYRLLTLDRDPETRLPTIEIAHEAMLTQWLRLSDWIAQNRASIQLRANLHQAAQDWLEGHQDEGYLASGAPLVNYETLLDNTVLNLTEEERGFLDASIARRRRGQRLRQAVVASLTVLAFVAAAFAVLAGDQSRRALDSAIIARARELAALSQSTLTDNQPQALLLSAAAVQTSSTYEARHSLLTALQTNPATTQYYHGHAGNSVWALDYRPDGQQIASGAVDGSLHLLDAATLTSTQVISAAHEGPIMRLDYSSDGTLLLSSGQNDGLVHLWDVTTGTRHTTLSGHAGAVRAAALSPDGLLAATGDESGTVRLWNTATGALLGDISAHSADIFDMAFSPDGTLLATGGADRVVRVWQISADGLADAALFEDARDNWVRSLAFSANGRLLATGDAQQTVRLYDVENQTLLAEATSSHAAFVVETTFSAIGNVLFTSGDDGSVQIWSTQSNALNPVATLGVHRGQVWGLAEHPERLAFATASHDGTVITWDLQQRPRPASDTLEAQMRIEQMAAHPATNQIAAAGVVIDESGQEGIAIRLWRDGELQNTLFGHAEGISSLAFSPDGSRLASVSIAANERILVWDTETGAIASTLDGHDTPMISVAYGIGGETLYSADTTGLIRLWRVETGELLSESAGADSPVLAVRPDGRVLAVGTDGGQVRLYNAEALIPLGDTITLLTDRILTLTYTSDGTRLVAAGRSGDIAIWDTQTNQLAHPILQAHSDWVLALALDDSGAILSSAGQDNLVRLWDLERGLPLGRPLQAHQNAITGLTFDGSQLRSGSRDGQIITWETSLSQWQDIACRLVNRDINEAEQAQFFPDSPDITVCET